VKHRIHLRSREVIEFVFHSASAILEIDGSEVSDGEIEILPPPRPGSPPLPGRREDTYTGGIVEIRCRERIDRIEINETKIPKEGAFAKRLTAASRRVGRLVSPAFTHTR